MEFMEFIHVFNMEFPSRSYAGAMYAIMELHACGYHGTKRSWAVHIGLVVYLLMAGTSYI